jgi:hypothetical protein
MTVKAFAATVKACATTVKAFAATEEACAATEEAFAVTEIGFARAEKACAITEAGRAGQLHVAQSRRAGARDAGAWRELLSWSMKKAKRTSKRRGVPGVDGDWRLYRELAQLTLRGESLGRVEWVRQINALVDGEIARSKSDEQKVAAMMMRITNLDFVHHCYPLPVAQARRLATSLVFWSERSAGVGSYISYQRSLAILLGIGDITRAEYKRHLAERVEHLRAEMRVINRWVKTDRVLARPAARKKTGRAGQGPKRARRGG